MTKIKGSLTILFLLMMSQFSLALSIGGVDDGNFAVDSTILSLFGGVFRFGSTILLVVQIIVTIICVLTGIWQGYQYLNGGQGADLGKLFAYLFGLIVIVILVWTMPKLLTKQSSTEKGQNGKISTGAVIKVIEIEEPTILDKIEYKK